MILGKSLSAWARLIFLIEILLLLNAQLPHLAGSWLQQFEPLLTNNWATWTGLGLQAAFVHWTSSGVGLTHLNYPNSSSMFQGSRSVFFWTFPIQEDNITMCLGPPQSYSYNPVQPWAALSFLFHLLKLWQMSFCGNSKYFPGFTNVRYASQKWRIWN